MKNTFIKSSLIVGLAFTGILFTACSKGGGKETIIREVVQKGNIFHTGTGRPASSVGDKGDFYLDTENYIFYGPKTEGGWPSTGTYLKGQDGKDGAQGPRGWQGADGQQGQKGDRGEQGQKGDPGRVIGNIYSGNGVPNSTLGEEGSFYYDENTGKMYGPKRQGIWKETVWNNKNGQVTPEEPKKPEQPENPQTEDKTWVRKNSNGTYFWIGDENLPGNFYKKKSQNEYKTIGSFYKISSYKLIIEYLLFETNSLFLDGHKPIIKKVQIGTKTVSPSSLIVVSCEENSNSSTTTYFKMTKPGEFCKTVVDEYNKSGNNKITITVTLKDSYKEMNSTLTIE